MPGGTSVGTIFLDLKIRNTIGAQFEKIVSGVEQSTKSAFKDTFEAAGKSAAAAVEKPLKQAAAAMKKPLQRAKEQALQTEEEIDAIVKRAVDRMNNAGKGGQPEKLRVAKRAPSKLATDPEDYMRRWDSEKLKLREISEEAGAASQKVKEETSRASAGAEATVKRTSNNIRNTVAQTANHAQKKVKSSASGIQKTLGRLGKTIQSVFKAVFLTSALYAAFRGLKSLFEGATKQSKEFSSALNEVKANLAIAFQPIIDAVMPALTALMQGLANVTRSIAAFIAGLFGKTYSQAADAAKKLQQVKTGADKAKGSLAGFDELNVIGNKSEESSGIDFGAVNAEGAAAAEGVGAKFAAGLEGLKGLIDAYVLEPIRNNLSKLQEPIDRFKGLLQSIGEGAQEWLAPVSDWFQGPFREALDNSIGNVTTRLATMMGTITMVGTTLWNFLKPIVDWFVVDGLPLLTGAWTELDDTITTASTAIHKAINTVWLGVVEPAFQLVSKIITDVGGIIKDLWDKYGAKTFENIREAIESGKNLFQTLWNNFLEPIFSNIFSVLTALWEEHLKPLVAQIGEFVMKLINGALEIYNGFIAPIVSWFVEIIGPVISREINKVISIIGLVVGAISDAVKATFGYLGGMIDFIVGVFTGDWNKAWQGIADSMKAIWNGMVSVVEGAINLVIEAINWMIDKVNSVVDAVPDKLFETIGPGADWRIPTIGKVELPRLASGAVIQQPTLAMMGEYAGARSNPEIVSPQSTMRETFLESIVPLLNALEEGFDRVIEAIRAIDPSLNIDGVELARILAPYLDKESVRRGKTIFQV